MSTYTLTNNPLPDLKRRQTELTDKYNTAIEMCHFYRHQVQNQFEIQDIFTATTLNNALDTSLLQLELWAGRTAILSLEVAEVANEIIEMEDLNRASEDTDCYVNPLPL